MSDVALAFLVAFAIVAFGFFAALLGGSWDPLARWRKDARERGERGYR